MDLSVNGGSKAIILAVILVVFGVVGWRMGAPDSFQAALSDAGLAREPAPAPAPTLVPGAPPAPETPQQPQQPNPNESASH